MSRPLPRDKSTLSATITQSLGLILALSALLAVTLEAADPSWWTSRSAVNVSLGTNDYAAVNQGQLKLFTARAIDELNADLATNGGAGTSLTALAAAWSNDYVSHGWNATNPKPADYNGVNAGQL